MASDAETRKHLRCPSKMLKARIVCTTTCRKKRCLYHPDYRERAGDKPVKLVFDPFFDDVEPIKKMGIKASRKRGK